MAEAENPKVGGCYIWVISFLLFICTAAGAIFLVLFMTQTQSTPSTYWYAIIGVSLVCLPWFFWLLTFLYRFISRAFGFRFICFRPFGAGYEDNEASPPANNGGAGLGTSVVVDSSGGGDGGREVKVGDQDGNEDENGETEKQQPGSPRRVHFGGVVIIGEENDDLNEKRESPKRSSSSSSSSSPSPSLESMQSNESEMPLKFFMAS